MLRIFGFVLFVSMVLIHLFCFVGQRQYPPMSVVVAVLGFIGIVLMQLGYRMEKYNGPIKKPFYPDHISYETTDDFGLCEEGPEDLDTTTLKL